MNNCDMWAEQISLRLDGALSGEDEALLQGHLISCAECRSLAQELSELRAAMAGLTADVPEGFSGRVMERIRQESAPEQSAAQTSKRKTPHWIVWSGLAAAMLIAAIGTGKLSLPGPALSGGSSNSTASAPAPAATPAPESADGGSGAYSAGAEEPAGNEGEVQLFMFAQPCEGNGDDQRDDELSGLFSASESDGFGGALTASEAARKVAETFSAPRAADFTDMEESEPLILTFAADGVTYTLEYAGLTDDDGSYLFILKGDDRTHQLWFATLDGQSVGQKEN